MCLAVIGRVMERRGEEAQVEIGGNRANVITVLVPEVKESDCVLIHAGFAIAVISEEEYAEHQRILNELKEYGDRTPGSE